MAVNGAITRAMLRQVCRLPIPGRYLAVELLTSRLTSSEPAVARIGHGLRMRCDLRDQVQRQIYYGLYDPIETAFLRTLLKPGDVVVDVGANVGYYSLLAAEAVGSRGHVYAFEPIAHVYATLIENVLGNKLTNVTAHQLAMASSTEPVDMFVRENAGSHGWSSIVPSERYVNQRVQVPATTLDEYVRSRGLHEVAAIKMDIEGAEPRALMGGACLLAREDAPNLICEINPYLLDRAGSSATGLRRLIASYGYTLYEITRRGLIPMAIESKDRALKNVFASKRRQSVGQAFG
jgi:FkbM family methyltransferase